METSQKTLIFGFAGLLMLILIVFFFMWKKKNTPVQNMEANATLQAQLQAQMQTQEAILQAQKMQGQQIEAQKEAQALAHLQGQQAQVQPTSNEEFPLKMGSYGLRVKKIQTFLQKKYGWNGKIDGKLGTETMHALKDKFRLTTNDFSQAKYEIFNIESVII